MNFSQQLLEKENQKKAEVDQKVEGFLTEALQNLGNQMPYTEYVIREEEYTIVLMTQGVGTTEKEVLYTWSESNQGDFDKHLVFEELCKKLEADEGLNTNRDPDNYSEIHFKVKR